MTDAIPAPHAADDDAPGEPRGSDHDVNTPFARRIDPSEDAHDHLEEKHGNAEDRQEALIDEGVEETFPASDPVSAKRIT
ncbi:hypothetical protein BZG35_07390 [Brevundimonas sp. LM2]|uniref:hypothetical protein n=1 Tax=Brevundimonas sp. LM2 TaxID=1938605 RepID=UPI0009838C27|nr:hypothetical protein [Brevundimonas sp. LM2]AQR61494.1 hypothetical protein BZG35_07390 [Brevundimonas sp. LM2]